MATMETKEVERKRAGKPSSVCEGDIAKQGTEQSARERGAYWDERVELMIPRDATNPQDGDVSIIVNGEIFQIQRGTMVRVPRYVYQAYMDAEAQKAVAYDKAMQHISRD